MKKLLLAALATTILAAAPCQAARPTTAPSPSIGFTAWIKIFGGGA